MELACPSSKPSARSDISPYLADILRSKLSIVVARSVLSDPLFNLKRAILIND